MDDTNFSLHLGLRFSHRVSTVLLNKATYYKKTLVAFKCPWQLPYFNIKKHHVIIHDVFQFTYFLFLLSFTAKYINLGIAASRLILTGSLITL